MEKTYGFVAEDNTGVAFGQPGQRQHDTTKDKCYHCLEQGYHAKECLKRETDEWQEGADFFNVENEVEEIEAELARPNLWDGADFFNMDEEMEIIDGVGVLKPLNADKG